MHADRMIQATAISPGLAIGPVHVVQAGRAEVPIWTVRADEMEAELARLAEAVEEATEELARRQVEVAQSAGKKDAEIFAVHRMILQDPTSLNAVKKLIVEDRINAEAAVARLISRFEAVADVSDPWRHVQDALLEGDRAAVMQSAEKVVLAAKELTPKVMTFVERGRILAVVAETGGRFSHGAVLARAFGVPCVLGIPNLLARLEQGMQIAVDGDRGLVQLQPDDEQIDEFLVRKRSLEARRETLRRSAALPSQTADGHPFDAQVNIESVRDLEVFDVSHSDGVGLLRTEFLYMERKEFPSEEEQFRLYRRVLQLVGERDATLRTLDIGGDKPLPYFHTPDEPNPALGWRGIRITLEWRDLLRVQLRAILRSSIHGRLRVLLPMVTNRDEIVEIREVFNGLRTELHQQGYEVASDVPVGIMVEVPSMLFVLDEVLDEVDFISVGTNDLVQYLLAADRDNPWVSKLYDPQHPAVMRALGAIADAAKARSKPASVCGDLAGDPAMAVLLMGMGYRGVSVAPNFLAEVKLAARKFTLEEARGLAGQALGCTSSAEVSAVLDSVRERLYDDGALDGAPGEA